MGEGVEPPAEGPSPVRVAGAGTLAIRYAPAPGFSGTDTIDYTLTNSNGTVHGTATVRVIADPVVPTPTPTPTPTPVPPAPTPRPAAAPAATASTLPNTGGPDGRLLGLAGLFLGAGGWLTLRGRRTSRDATLG